MAKKKKIEKVTEIVNFDRDGNIVTQKLTGNTGGYTRETTPALVKAAQEETIKTVEPTVKTARENSAVKKYGFNLSNAITDLANMNEAIQNERESIPIIGKFFKANNTLKKTALNAATNMGEGALKTGEGVLDTLNDWADAINNPLTYTGNKAVYGKEKADKILKEDKKKQEEFIKKNLVQELKDKSGYEDVREDLEKDSLIKQDNFGGQIAQGVGGMVPALLAGQYLGYAPEMTSTKGLSGLTKAKAVAGNLAKSYASQLPSNTILGASSYGSGIEEALNEGATREQARKYGLANTAIEQGTEYLTGGIPGLGGKGGLDDVVEPLIDKNSRGYANALLKAGYGAFGEGLEEYAGAMLDPLAKKIYSDKPIDWKETNKQALQAGLVGAATGAILNSPSSIQDIQNARNEIRNQQAQRVQETPVQPSVTQNNINTQEQVQTTPTRQENEQINTQQVQTTNPQTIETKPVAKLTQQEQQELDTLKDFPFELDEQQERRMDELLLKQNKDLEKNMSPVRNLSDVRDFNEVGSKKVNAYQYDNPEVKPYFQEVAKDMLYDLGNSTKGERYMTEDGQFKGVKRNVPNDIAELLDGENGVKYSYKEIEDGLNAIIKDNGAENKAVAKRLEFYIDQRLRNGYMDSIAGRIPANSEYIETLRDKNLGELNRQSQEAVTQIPTKENQIKNEQLKIIEKNNPMTDDYHVGIRDVNDIKTFDEAIQDDESFTWGDYSKEDAQRDLEKGTVTVYSSKPIEQGSFVSTSKNQARDYAGGEKIYSQDVPINDVAWVNGDEGQYAKVEGTSDSSFSNNKNNVLYENKQEEEPTLKINEDGTSEIVDNKPQILEKMPQQKQTIKEKLTNRKNQIRQHFTDHQSAIYDISRQFKNPTLYHKADAIQGSDSLAQRHIGESQTNLTGKSYKNFTDEKGNKVTMGFEKAYDLYKDIPVKAKNEYLVHELNLDRLSQGVEQFENITGYESEEKINELKEKYPEIEKWADNIYQYNRNQLQNMVDGGLISQQMADEFMKNTPHYVRIQRDVNGNNSALKLGNNRVDINNQIQTVKGGTYDILPIKETAAQYTQDVLKSIKLNQFGQELAKTIGVGSANDNISSVDESFGINPDILTKDGKNYNFTIFNKGQATTIPINEGIYQSLMPRDIKQAPVVSSVAKVQRELLTNKNPYFALRNAVKDAGDMFLYSKYSMPKNIATYTELFAGRTIGKLDKSTNRTRTSDWVNLYKNTAGDSASVFKQGEFTSNKGKVAKTIDKVLSPIENANEFIESMPRITEFVNTIRENGYTLNTDGELVAKKGKKPTKSVEDVLSEAVYNAAEVTTNFKRGGTWAKNIDKNGGIFFNASVQGAAKLGRTFTEAFGDARSGNYKAAKRLVSRALALGIAPALLSSFMYDDDKDYQDLPDYVKDQYYLIKGKDGNFVRIPKGRAVSLFDSLARRGIDKAKGKDNVMDNYGTLVMNQVAPNNPLDNNVFSPLFAVANNKAWSGNQIESDYLQTLPKGERYDAKTSEFSKWLGKQFGVSPKKTDYLIDQYSGVLGDIFLPSTTNYAESEDSSGYNALVNPLKSQFTVNPTLSNKTTGDYYDMVEKINQKGNSQYATTLDKAKKKYVGDYSDVKTQLSDLYRQQREIQNSNMSDSEKYNQNIQIQRQIIDLMKKTEEELNNATENNGVVTIGDRTYYLEEDKDGQIKLKSMLTKKYMER